MRWFVVCLAALAVAAGYTLSKGLGADSALRHATGQGKTDADHQ